ncbi:MAG: hypothetical protein CVV64_08635 [Candidatus Wallbacteria bacterium HGW-Wallbacteria-1]|jgi:tetratricopeptide (TPR) repeat protein|uniref:Uncharacterized protein n=1 Tax=Candidatus Wallbacteria bacterium HGW-Wallbacteria-1 TaxID=2013854 RepID=A0A2N1PQ12_9BACT|nr:MAG: hypothetical protein CVV64_08635 [Candidatus Wallbacteria bacterium HGW-Wallbacteria-1]
MCIGNFGELFRGKSYGFLFLAWFVMALIPAMAADTLQNTEPVCTEDHDHSAHAALPPVAAEPGPGSIQGGAPVWALELQKFFDHISSGRIEASALAQKEILKLDPGKAVCDLMSISMASVQGPPELKALAERLTTAENRTEHDLLYLVRGMSVNGFEAGVEKSLKTLMPMFRNPDVIASAYSLLGSQYLNAGNPQEALKMAEKALAVSADNIDALVIRGDASMQVGDFDTALGAFKKAAEKTDAPQISDMILTCYLEKGMFSEAMAVIDEKMKVSPSDVALMKLRIQCLYQDKRTAEAMALADKYMAQLPDSADIVTSKAFLLFNNESPGDAVTLLQGFIDKHPREASTLFYMANLLFQMNDQDAAQVYALRAIEADPTVPEHYLIACDTYLAKGKKDEALALLRKGMENAADPVAAQTIKRIMNEIENQPLAPSGNPSPVSPAPVSPSTGKSESNSGDRK